MGGKAKGSNEEKREGGNAKEGTKKREREGEEMFFKK